MHSLGEQNKVQHLLILLMGSPCVQCSVLCRFDLAIQLGDLPTAQEIAAQLDTPAKWKQLGELAMGRGQLDMAGECLEKAEDLAGRLLLVAAQGNRAAMTGLAETAAAAGKMNVAFLALFLLGQTERCVQLLLSAGRLPEAALFARAYLPSQMSQAVKVSNSMRAVLSGPSEDMNGQMEGWVLLSCWWAG